jgi:hypothetical protein
MLNRERHTQVGGLQLEGKTSSSRRSLFVEGAVILVSIVLAFGLDAWWDSLAEGRQMREQLGSVEAEVRENRELVLFQVDLMERIIGASTALVAALDSAGPSARTITIPDSMAWLPLNTPTLDASLGAIDALVASGQLAQIRDPEVRTRLAGLRDRIEDAVEEQDQAVTVFYDHLYPRLVDQGYRTSSVIEESIFDFWAERIPGRPVRSFGTVECPVDPSLAELLGERRRLYRISVDEMRDLLVVLDDLEQAVVRIR